MGRLTEAERAAVRRLSANRTLREMADEFGVSHDTPRQDMLDSCLQSSLAERSGSVDAIGAYAVTSSNGKRGGWTAPVNGGRRGA